MKMHQCRSIWQSVSWLETNKEMKLEQEETNSAFACIFTWVVAAAATAALVWTAREAPRPTAWTWAARVTARWTARVATTSVTIVTTAAWIPSSALAAAATERWRAPSATVATAEVIPILWPSLIHRTTMVVHVIYNAARFFQFSIAPYA